MKRVLSLCAAVAVLAASFNMAQAGKFNRKVSIGDKAPEINKLAGADGKEHSLADYKDAKLVAVVFTCNSCPIAVAFEDRLINLQKKYAEQGVKLVAVNANSGDNNALEAMKQRAADKKFNFPYLYDQNREIATAYGATCTPHVFLLNQDRQIVYMGSIEDNIVPEQVKYRYLQDAIDAVLAGGEPETAETLQFGCGIK